MKLLPLFILLVSASVLYGQSPAWLKELSTRGAGPYKAQKKCTLEYVLSWNGTINSGEMVVHFDRNKGQNKAVEVRSEGGTRGLAKALFPYRFKSSAQYRGHTLKPISFDLWEATRDESKKIQARFRRGKVSSQSTTTLFESQEVSKRTHTFAHPHLYDLFTSALYIGSQPLVKGEQLSLIVYPFDRPYLAQVRVLGRETHLGHPCIKLDLKLRKIQPDMQLKAYKKMKSATMWITDNSDRIMVELRSEIFIGDVRATLKRSTWN